MIGTLRSIFATRFMGAYTIGQIVGFFAIVLVSLVLGRTLQYLLERFSGRIGKSRGKLVAFTLEKLAQPLVVIIFACGFLGGVVILGGYGQHSFLRRLSDVLFTLGIGYAVYRLVDVLDVYLKTVSDRTETGIDDMLMPLLVRSLRITVVVIAGAQVFHALSDQELSTVIAGLGLGGLAFALAGQDTIKNFFGSLVILADKPFAIGDRIVVEGFDGPVEGVGFRSTRLRTLDGDLVTLPNSEMVSKAVRNIGKRPFMRRVTEITVTYDTPPAKIEQGVQLIKEILEANADDLHPNFPSRVYFLKFANCSLNIHMEYWFRPPDKWQFFAYNEKINFEILKQFNDAGIEFAFPTQTIYVANDDKRQLALRMLQDRE